MQKIPSLDYMGEALANIASVSLHWSSDCNMACKYCYIEKEKKCMASYNRDIRQALEDGTFVENVKRVTAPIKHQIENISLWGAEPTINSQYWTRTFTALFDYFPNAHEVMFSTNALLGDRIYDDFFIPMMVYATQNKRKISFNLQMSLDGPPEFNDDSRHPGATASTLKTMKEIISRCPADMEYFTLTINTKATLDVSYMRIMNERGIEAFNWYYKFFNDLQLECDELGKGKKNLSLQIAGCPTLVDPGYYTKDDGITFAQWLNLLPKVDTTKLKAYAGRPLFGQLLTGPETFMQAEAGNAIVNQENSYSCSASKNNITIDHEGNVYTCNRLCRNAALNDDMKTKHAMQSGCNMNTSDKVWMKRTYGAMSFHADIMSRKYFFDQMAVTMAQAGQIDNKYAWSEDDRLMMFMMVCGLYCHIGVEEDYTSNPSIVPCSYLRLLGNGAQDAMLRYYKILVSRKEYRPWLSTAM